MTPAEFRQLTERLRAVPIPGVDCADTLRVFGVLTKKHGWTEALDAFDRIAAEQLPAPLENA